MSAFQDVSTLSSRWGRTRLDRASNSFFFRSAKSPSSATWSTLCFFGIDSSNGSQLPRGVTSNAFMNRSASLPSTSATCCGFQT